MVLGQRLTTEHVSGCLCELLGVAVERLRAVSRSMDLVLIPRKQRGCLRYRFDKDLIRTWLNRPNQVATDADLLVVCGCGHWAGRVAPTLGKDGSFRC